MTDTSPELLAFLKQTTTTAVADEPWESLAANGRWEEALPEIEQLLVAEPERPLLRLWWTQCQLELNRLPVTALTAPLDEIAKSIKPHAELHMLCVGTLTKAALAVIRKNQFRLGVGLLERALEVSQDSLMVSASNVQELRKAYRDVLGEELKRAPARKEARSYLDSLERKLVEIEASINNSSIPGIPLAESPLRSASKRLSSKSMLVEAESIAGEHDQPHEPSSPKAISRGKSKWVKRAVAALLVIVAFGALLRFAPSQLSTLVKGFGLFRSSDSASSGVTSGNYRGAIAMIGPTVRSMTLPNPDTAGEGSGIDGVGKRLAQLSVTRSGSTRTEASLAADPEIDHNALKGAAGRSLPAPAKPVGRGDDDVVSLSNIPQAENAIKENRLPMADPSKYATTEVESIGTSEKRAPIPPEVMGGLSVDPNGRVFGPPKSSPDPGRPRSSIDGGPLKSYEVKQFNPPLLYRTITSTEVLSAPSLVSSGLARLENNTPIHVTAQMGQWLELRSTGGKVGYIYAQDATPTK